MRLIVEIIFRGFARIEKLGKQNLSENKELVEIINKKTKWLRQIIFENAFISEEKICLMNRFEKIVAKFIYKDLFEDEIYDKYNLTIQQFKFWDGKDCFNLEEQKEEINLIRIEMEEHHTEFLIADKKINELNLEQLGRKCRLNKLISNSFKIFGEDGKNLIKN
nr:unnamed protein product [Meloidogyne enterolobii]